MNRVHSASPPEMKNEYFPGLFRSADAASGTAQGKHLLLQRACLGLLILGSIIAVVTALAASPLSTWLYSATAIVLALGFLILWVSRSRRDSKAWFDCRSIAESVKTATWHFMMNAAPFHPGGMAEELFISELREIRQGRPDCRKHLAGLMDADASAITLFMRQMRLCPFEKRKAFYMECRIRDQKSWYSQKAKMNAHGGARWFWVTAALQALAVTIAVIQVAAGGFTVNMIPALTTCAAAATAWSQMKRHDELAHSYVLAAQELQELESIVDSLNVESSFARLVEQVEEAVSREHTLWCVRRDVLLANGRADSTGQRKRG